MSSETVPNKFASAPTLIKSRINEDRFNWLYVILSLWYVGGLYLDGWAHHHGRVDDSFFTPWHAVFYSGFMVTAIALLYVIWHNHRVGGSWLEAIPAGYGLTLIGSLMFAIGGAGDMVWHTLYGIEEGVEALVSPSHLLLAIGMGMVVSGPLRSAWQQPQKQDLLPWYAILSASFFLGILTFITMYLQPIYGEYPLERVSGWVLRDYNQAVGISSVLVSTTMLCGVLFSLMRRWKNLPFGTFTAVIGITTIALTTLEDTFRFIPSLLVAGLAIDVLYLLLKPSSEKNWQLRLFAIALPVIYFGFYYQAIWASGLWWTIHVWTGTIVMAGVVGILISYLVFPAFIPPLDQD